MKESDNMESEKINKDLLIVKYQNTENVLEDICSIIDSAQKYAYKAINVALIERNWFIGYRIAEEELKGNNRAEYGENTITKLSKELTNIYGKGFAKTSLYNCYTFYKMFQNIFQSPIGKSEKLLSWTHYLKLLQVQDTKAREWYEKEAFEQDWSVRTLQRNISSQYYYRLLKSQIKEPVIEEMKKITSKYDSDKLEFIKNPVIAEFLGFTQDQSCSETELETSIISNIQKFLLELRKGIFVCGETTTYTY